MSRSPSLPDRWDRTPRSSVWRTGPASSIPASSDPNCHRPPQSPGNRRVRPRTRAGRFGCRSLRTTSWLPNPMPRFPRPGSWWWRFGFRTDRRRKTGSRRCWWKDSTLWHRSPAAQSPRPFKLKPSSASASPFRSQYRNPEIHEKTLWIKRIASGASWNFGPGSGLAARPQLPRGLAVGGAGLPPPGATCTRPVVGCTTGLQGLPVVAMGGGELGAKGFGENR